MHRRAADCWRPAGRVLRGEQTAPTGGEGTEPTGPDRRGPVGRTTGRGRIGPRAARGQGPAGRPGAGTGSDAAQAHRLVDGLGG